MTVSLQTRNTVLVFWNKFPSYSATQKQTEPQHLETGGAAERLPLLNCLDQLGPWVSFCDVFPFNLQQALIYYNMCIITQ